ncbi:hypothetical protein O988_09929 [Pseudogymnoascus sp. VKM F-3808]|nr:hypothetical protein O988_09929 [Pseudogymnoascus sp. VKM F-3808]
MPAPSRPRSRELTIPRNGANLGASSESAIFTSRIYGITPGRSGMGDNEEVLQSAICYCLAAKEYDYGEAEQPDSGEVSRNWASVRSSIDKLKYQWINSLSLSYTLSVAERWLVFLSANIGLIGGIRSCPVSGTGPAHGRNPRHKGEQGSLYSAGTSAMSGGVPHGALGLSVIVLLYSFLCLFLGILLFCVCWRHGARSSYVSLIAAFASLACAASIAQQIHFATDWVSIKEAQRAARERDPTSPILIVTGSTQGADLGLFWIQFASYNSDSLLILFWAASLFQGTWKLKPIAKLQTHFSHLETIAKLIALFFPPLLLGIAHTKDISSNAAPYLVLCNISLVISLLIGGILLILTLYKFITLKNKFSSVRGSSGNSRQEALRLRRRDKWIIIRFSIAFSILAVFEVAIISFEVLQYNISHSPTPYHPGSDSDLPPILTEIAQFAPGVTPPLVAFLIWGTTDTYWQEIKRWFSCYISRRRSPSMVSGVESSNSNFERLGDKDNQKVFAATTELRNMRDLEAGRAGQRSI